MTIRSIVWARPAAYIASVALVATALVSVPVAAAQAQTPTASIGGAAVATPCASAPKAPWRVNAHRDVKDPTEILMRA